MAKFKLSIHNEERMYEVIRQGDEIIVRYGEETAVCHLIHNDNQTYLLEWVQENGVRKQIQLAGHKEGDQRQLWINGRILTATRIRARATATNNANNSLAATIPAIVSQILVNIGDSVTAGDKLILLESMKMVIPIQAPYNGTISAINCTTGESIQAGIQLINLEEDGD